MEGTLKLFRRVTTKSFSPGIGFMVAIASVASRVNILVMSCSFKVAANVFLSSVGGHIAPKINSPDSTVPLAGLRWISLIFT